jgi:hypothetical protein
MALKYKKETWMLNKRDKQWLEAAHVIPTTITRIYKIRLSKKWWYKRKTEVQSIVDEIQTYQKNWKEHVKSMQDDRQPKLAFKYKSTGK